MGRLSVKQVGIVTDTFAQLTQDVIQEWGIKVVPAATINCDGRTFVDGVDIDIAGAFRLLAADPEKFTTSAIPPTFFIQAFEEMARTTRQIFCVTASSKLTSGFSSAKLAATLTQQKTEGLRIQVFDSMNAAGGEGLVALTAAKASAKGLNLDEVFGLAQKAHHDLLCYFVFDTLSYTYRTGRIPKIAAQGGDILRVKPLVRIGVDGKVRVIGLVRDRDRGVQRIKEIIMKTVGKKSVYVVVMHAAALNDALELRSQLLAEFNCREIMVSEFSPVMGYATGPGVLGIAACPEYDILR